MNLLWTERFTNISDNVFTKGNLSDISKFIEMRNTDKIADEGLTVIDDSRNEEIFVELRSDCSFEIVKSKWSGNKSPLIIKIMGMDADGNSLEGDCAVNYTVNWGDGHSDNYSQNISYWMIQYYDIPPGECKTYTVTIKINILFFSVCNNGIPKTYNLSRTFSVCSSVSCTPDEGEDDWIVDTYIYNNGKNRAVFYMGYDLYNYFWHDACVYGKIKHYRKKSNGNWKRKKPNKFIDITIQGKWFIDNCDGHGEYVYKNKRRRKSRLRNTKKRDGNDMFLRSDDQMFCDFKVYHSSSSYPDVELIDEPF